MEKKYVVALKDAVTGVLHGRAGTAVEKRR